MEVAQRSENLRRLDGGDFDVIVIGGGINGAVSAAALAGRGASVALVDRGDFGAFTSQESSNLVWGGFKYLENYELGLVYRLCRSRNELMKSYPDNVREIGFLATLDKSAPYRPWFAGVGATAYWAIGRFGTKPPKVFSRRRLAQAEPAISTTTARGAIQYQDAYLIDNDSRFVFSFIRSAFEAGAVTTNYVELVHAERRSDRWHVALRDVVTGDEMTASAQTLVNAVGPFVDALNKSWGTTTTHRIVYSKGIHLVVPRLTTTDHDRVLAFFDDSQRLFYVIPMGRRSVVGTTDTRVDDPHTAVTEEDRSFLLEQINARMNLEKPLEASDVIAERSGVRPLVVKVEGEGSDDWRSKEWTSLSRRHEVECDAQRSVVTVFGGKLTDCLNVGAEVASEIESLGVALEADQRNWYGEPDSASRAEFFRQAHLMHLDEMRPKPDTESLSVRLWRRYGRRAFDMLEHIRDDPSMATDVMESADYLRVELHNAADHEMIVKLDDFMRRRSKIDLVVADAEFVGSDGLAEISQLLFGDDGERKLDEFYRERAAAVTDR
ncbi:MAG: FAD-dependent oxidoreductase [Actinomycetota bacterium]|nr:FAD-dependent oxidoreductase [Actinomycetota bacterium]